MAKEKFERSHRCLCHVVRDQIYRVSGVIEGAPAADVDLRANDIIYEVDGVSTAGKTLTEAVNMIRGEAGTTVDLTIVRRGLCPRHRREPR